MKKIIWSFDPFEEKDTNKKNVLTVLEAVAGKGEYQIEPVYVLSPQEYELESRHFKLNPTAYMKQHITPLQKVIDSYLEDLNVPSLLPAQILLENTPSLSKTVMALVTYARQSNADLIAVGTHARHGLPRLFLGSFAETLMLESKIPMLVIGPHAGTAKIGRILFATDFGWTSEALFAKVVALARDQRAQITLFHSIPRPVDAIVESSVFLISGGYPSFPDFVAENESEKRKLADRYVESARKQDVQVELKFDSQRNSVTEAILEAADKSSSSMIAMAAESGPVASALVGSIARQVVRGARCPVWIMRA